MKIQLRLGEEIICLKDYRMQQGCVRTPFTRSPFPIDR